MKVYYVIPLWVDWASRISKSNYIIFKKDEIFDIT